MTKEEYERNFRQNPDEFLAALQAIKSIIVDLAHQNKPAPDATEKKYMPENSERRFVSTLKTSVEQLYN